MSSIEPACREQLRDALCQAFNQDELEQMVLYKIGLVLFNFVQHGPLETVVFQFLELAEREGWLEALVRAAHISRPNNLSIQAVVDRCCPESATLPRPCSIIGRLLCTRTGDNSRRRTGTTIRK